MDVRCSTCQEPWDVDHLRHEAIFETSLGTEEAEAWRSLPFSQKLSDQYRRVFREARWEFGQSVINVLRCPCCPKDAKADPNRVELKDILEGLLGSDEDGLAATFEDFKL